MRFCEIPFNVPIRGSPRLLKAIWDALQRVRERLGVSGCARHFYAQVQASATEGLCRIGLVRSTVVRD